jgi:mRNA-degrading endonuclease RelE of RelBE toxin-antitoxin system
MYRVELSKRALRDLRRIDHKRRKRLLDYSKTISPPSLSRPTSTLRP